MAKARDAFRTISEVAGLLDTPAHVLRFWESKFTQIKPVKRAGGRRYYRPDDINLLAGIKHLLHEQGMTIKGAQKLLREEGIKHVANLKPSPIDSGDVSAETKTPVLAPVATLMTDTIQEVKVRPSHTPTLKRHSIARTIPDRTSSIRQNAKDILPLLARLESLHRQMTAG